LWGKKKKIRVSRGEQTLKEEKKYKCPRETMVVIWARIADTT